MGTPDQTIFHPGSQDAVHWHIEIAEDGRPVVRTELVGASIVIGRAAGCGVRLDHPSVSRGHARLDLSTGGRWAITDLGSHNGTIVNGQRVSTVELERRDQIAIGPFKLRLEPVGPMVRVGPANDGAVVQTLGELGRPRLAVEQLNRLDEFGRQILSTPDGQLRLIALCRLMLHPEFGGRWAVCVDASGDGEAVPVCPPQSLSAQVPTLSRTLIRAAVDGGEPVIANNCPNLSTPSPADIEMSISPDVVMLAAVAVPLSSTTDGTTRLLCAGFPPQYGTGEWLALCGLAARQYRQTETVWANIAAGQKLAALEADLERARQVQDRLVPKHVSLPGLDVAVRFRPCHGVGGDYVDAVPLPDSKALVVIADVSGKGLAAAMVAMGLHTVVHAAARRWTGLPDLAAVLDAHLVESLPPESFVTLMAMTICPTTGDVETVNAGHPPAVVFGASGHCRQLGTDSDMMLGPFPQTLNLTRDRLGIDESLLLFTDGCLEVFDAAGEMLGTDELCRRSSKPITTAVTAASAADEVVKTLDAWQGEGDPGDDRTLLLLRRRRGV